ncbi:MAG: UDP-N-acetylglucosamine 1-carboxyvinyltransferase [Victivallaceae bacterium]|nr:UDP-N-acetylglucosamine 1-carboxyvinyltransferase [Victivallaceae bacterium]
MSILTIEGGAKLDGEISVSGNKNAVLPMLAAAFLTDEPIQLHNVPDILDVRTMLEIASALGAQYDFSNDSLTICTAGLHTACVSSELCAKNRTSVLFAAPLLHRMQKAELSLPGGDGIGRRRLDGHIYGLKSLGAHFLKDKTFAFETAGRLRGRELFLDEASVTATEHILLAAVLAEGTTVLYNAACEPHVADLAELLNRMGAKISGHGSNTITIVGVDSLHRATHTVASDHIEAGSFIALAAATGARLTIRGTSPRYYWMTRRVFERLGVRMTLHPDRIFVPGGQAMRIDNDFGGYIPTISDGTWPQYPSDMMSCTIVAATQARGTALFFEKMFESRLYFVDRLIAMGANAIVCDPHRVVVTGRTKLHGMSLSSPDIRAGMAMVIAALCANGTSKISNSQVIRRGYSDLVGKLTRIGAKIREED